jgi:hypothetical protein
MVTTIYALNASEIDTIKYTRFHYTSVIMVQTIGRLTDAQRNMINALNDASEHTMYEWDKPDPESYGTCGFAHIGNIDGRGSFVQRAKSLADTDSVSWVTRDRRNTVSGRVAPVSIEIGSLDLRLAPAHGGGYRLSISNVAELVGGPAHQRLAVRRELHRLLLERLRGEWGYFNERTRVCGRVD